MSAITDHQSALVQSSFAKLIENIDRAAALFFEQLFTLDPSLKPLFRSDLQGQGRKMIQTLLMIVNAINDPAAIRDLIEATSRRHVIYGVQREYYPIVGQALQATLRLSLGDACTPEVAEAWAAAYQSVAAVAIAAAYPIADQTPR